MGKAKINKIKIMKHALSFLFILTAIVSSFGQTKGKENGHKTIEGQSNKIVGTWKLVEFANLDTATNSWIHPYGKNPKGFISYSKSGVVNINVSSEIPLKIPKDSIENFKINLQDFRRNYSFGYFGTYSVDNEKMVVTFHVTGGTIPEYINTDQPRPIILTSDTLIIGDNKTWKRVLIKVD